MFISDGYGYVDEGVPSLSRMTSLGVRVSGEDLDRYFSPQGCVLTSLPLGFCCTTAWPVCDYAEPEVLMETSMNQPGRFDIFIDMKYDKENDRFTGSGLLAAENCLNPIARMMGLSDQTESYLSSMISGIVDGAKLNTFNPERFDDRRVVIGFEFELEMPEPDDHDRISLLFRQPSEGILRLLPGDVHLYHQRRSSPVHLPSNVGQSITVRIDADNLEAVFLPVGQNISNGCGNFALSVEEDDGKLMIQRSLTLKKAVYDPDDWQDLRSLLLSDSHERNRTVLLRETNGKVE
jgi:hypothetical protein